MLFEALGAESRYGSLIARSFYAYVLRCVCRNGFLNCLAAAGRLLTEVASQTVGVHSNEESAGQFAGRAEVQLISMKVAGRR
jgi:hypothetical protein